MMDKFKIDNFESLRDLYDSWVGIYSEFMFSTNGFEREIGLSVFKNLIRDNYGVDLYFPNNSRESKFSYVANLFYRMSYKPFPSNMGMPYKVEQTFPLEGFYWNYGDSINVHGVRFTCGINPKRDNKFTLGYKILKTVYELRKKSNVPSN